MIKTTEYFNMSIDELSEVRNKYGYTKEDCKIFDDGIKVIFFNNIEEYEKEKEIYKNWIKEHDSSLELKAELLTINGRVATIYY